MLATEIMPVEERDITVNELTRARENFLTFTTKKLLSVIKLNGNIIGAGTPGVATWLLYEKFIALKQMIFASRK